MPADNREDLLEKHAYSGRGVAADCSTPADDVGCPARTGWNVLVNDRIGCWCVGSLIAAVGIVCRGCSVVSFSLGGLAEANGNYWNGVRIGGGLDWNDHEIDTILHPRIILCCLHDASFFFEVSLRR